MPLQDVRDMMMSPPDEPGPIDRFIDAYEDLAKQLEAARRQANQNRNKLWHAMICEVAERHRQPHLGYQRLETERKRARDQFAIDNDKAKLDAAEKEAEAQNARDVRAEYADRDLAIIEWKKVHGASQTAEIQAFDCAAEKLFSAFRDALELAVSTASASAATVVAEYQAGAEKANALTPIAETENIVSPAALSCDLPITQ